ncbi:hypothetical protein ACS126_04620 [Sphingobacterium lactis]|uniref:hypothetical protein n=1 Tax=Sphingobacterium lactis TaxID=797291 RepID=UPI003EC7DBB2
MSEQNSLVIQVQISPEKLAQMRQSASQVSLLDENMKTWWASREMYGKSDLIEIPTYNVRKNQDLLAEFVGDRYLVARESYDEERQVWTFFSLQFSENYTEILPLIGWIKGLASYLDQGAEGFAIIYDYQWGSEDVMAYIKLEDQKAKLTNAKHIAEIPHEDYLQAKDILDNFMDDMQDQ